MTTPTDHPVILTPTEVMAPVRRPSRKRQAVAFLIAAVSDFLSFWTVLAPPMQWLIDLGTALLLFLILGRRWAILPGLLAEAIPGMGVFPWWVLVVLSIIAYDDIKGRKRPG
jgi:hypothetical protein